MSISTTRKVSSSPSAPRTERGYNANGKNTQFVEHIDTQNNVLVRDDTNEHSSQGGYYSKENSENPKTEISPSSAYVHNNINALAASGVLEDTKTDSNTSHKVGVYDNNQSIIRDEELERTGRNYLKHFYEKNEHLTDIDKLI